MSTATRPRSTNGAPTRADRIETRPHRRRVVLWSLGVVTVAAGLALGAAYSPLLDVEQVDVVGARADHEQAVLDAAGVEPGDSIVTMRPGVIADRVRGLPWVATATVTRDFPRRVEIRVTERVPVGWVEAGEGALVVDRDAAVLWRVDTPPVGIPELVGVVDVAPPGGRVRPVVVAAVAAALAPEVRSRSAAVILDDGAATVVLAGGPQIRFGAPTGLAVKARVAAAVLASVGPAPVKYVDVSVPAAPVSG